MHKLMLGSVKEVQRDTIIDILMNELEYSYRDALQVVTNTPALLESGTDFKELNDIMLKIARTGTLTWIEAK